MKEEEIPSNKDRREFYIAYKVLVAKGVQIVFDMFYPVWPV
jgi:hypothetical protein